MQPKKSQRARTPRPAPLPPVDDQPDTPHHSPPPEEEHTAAADPVSEAQSDAVYLTLLLCQDFF